MEILFLFFKNIIITLAKELKKMKEQLFDVEQEDSFIFSFQKDLLLPFSDLRPTNDVDSYKKQIEENQEEDFEQDYRGEEPLSNQFSPPLWDESSAQEELDLEKEITQQEFQKNTLLQAKKLGEQKVDWTQILLKIAKSKKKKVKNGNTPKMLCKLGIQYWEIYEELFKKNQAVHKELKKIVKDQKRLCKIDKNRNNKLNSLKYFFGQSGKANPSERSRLMRKMLHHVLRSQLEKQVILNPQVKLMKEYLKCLKVFSLRCKSKNLIERLECQ